MFSKAFQKGDGGVEIFSPTGTDPLRSLELKNKSAISKVYDRYIKGNCLILDQTSVSSSISCPSSSSKTLGIVQPWFCLQLNIPKGKSFSLELVVSETTGQHHRVHFSTSFRGWDANELHARIAWPKEYDSLWVTYVINLEELCRVCFRSTFASLDHFTVYSTCQIRKIFSLSAKMTDVVIPAAFDFPIGVAAEIYLVGLPAKVDKGAASAPSKPPQAGTGKPRGKAAGAAQTAPMDIGVLGVKKQLTASSIAANTQVADNTHMVPESKTVEQRGPHPKGTGGKLMHGTLQKAEEKQRPPRRDEIVPFDDDDDHDNELLALRAVDAHTERSLDDAKSYPMNGSHDRARVSYSHQVSQEKPPDRDLSSPWGGAASPAKEAFYNDIGRDLSHADPHPIASPISSSSRQRPATSEHSLRQSAAKAADEAEAKATPRRPPLDSKDLRDADATNEWELVQQLLRTQERNPWQTSLPSSPSLVAPSRSSATAAAPARSSSFGLQRSIVDGVIDGGHSKPSETPRRRSGESLHAAESPSSDRWDVRSSDTDGALLPHARPVPVPQSVLLAQESGEPHSDIFASSEDASVASRDVRLSIGTAPLRPVGQSPAQSVEAFGAQDGDGRSEAVDWRPHGDYVYPSSARTLRSPSPDPPAEGPRERDTRLVQASQSVENFLAARRQAIDQEPVDQHVFASIQRWEERITQLLVVNDTDSLRLPTAPTAVHEVHDLCDSLKRLECEFWRSFGREDYEQDVGYFEFE
jgi:hypothetical protein